MTPPRPILLFGWALHRVLFRLTRGRVGTQRAGDGLGTLFLRSRGRKSGAIRRTALFYIADGGSFVVVASNAGDPAEPGWWLNLQANPAAAIALPGEKIAVRARAATAEERAGLWPRLDAANPEYARYRATTKREIAIVILEPR